MIDDVESIHSFTVSDVSVNRSQKMKVKNVYSKLPLEAKEYPAFVVPMESLHSFEDNYGKNIEGFEKNKTENESAYEKQSKFDKSYEINSNGKPETQRVDKYEKYPPVDLESVNRDIKKSF